MTDRSRFYVNAVGVLLKDANDALLKETTARRHEGLILIKETLEQVLVMAVELEQ